MKGNVHNLCNLSTTWIFVASYKKRVSRDIPCLALNLMLNQDETLVDPSLSSYRSYAEYNLLTARLLANRHFSLFMVQNAS